MIAAVKDKEKIYNPTSQSKKVSLLCVVIVSVCGDNEDKNFDAVYFVYKSVLLVDAAGPCALLVFAERLGDSTTSCWMQFEFFQHTE